MGKAIILKGIDLSKVLSYGPYDDNQITAAMITKGTQNTNIYIEHLFIRPERINKTIQCDKFNQGSMAIETYYSPCNANKHTINISHINEHPECGTVTSGWNAQYVGNNMSNQARLFSEVLIRNCTEDFEFKLIVTASSNAKIKQETIIKVKKYVPPEE